LDFLSKTIYLTNPIQQLVVIHLSIKYQNIFLWVFTNAQLNISIVTNSGNQWQKLANKGH
ncbi:hypothetical protein R3X43_28485, partial [Salmonella enterica subsp. enterica serovar Typhimurium]|uniref:hypothetical protein n=1 Tax=Salmonella enterica TaxID=28901 RepID=UPI002A7537E1